MVIEPNYNEEIEYVSPTRQQIKNLLKDWHLEISAAKKREVTEQQQNDLERETKELSAVMNILSQVAIPPRLDPTDPDHDGIIIY